MEKSLYLSLCSTDSLETFSKNTCDTFTNVLPQTLRFTRPMEISLCELHYTNTINTITKDCSLAIFDFLYKWPADRQTDARTDGPTEGGPTVRQTDGSKAEYGRLYDLKLPDGFYTSVEQLCLKLNQLVANLNITRLKNVQLFTYDSVKRRFSINVKDLWLCVVCKAALIDVLGLESRHFVPHQVCFIGLSKNLKFYVFQGEKRFFRNQTQEWVSDSVDGGLCPYVANLNVKNTMLVYISCIKDQIFGSTFTNLLRTIPLSDKENARIVHSFDSRIYLPLKSDNLSSITVTIRDFNAQKLNFLSDNIYLLLHIRPQE